MGSSRSREAKETRQLYERVQGAFAASRFADPSTASAFIMHIVLEAGHRAGGVPTIPLGEALYTLVRTIIDDDGLLYGFPEISSFEDMPIDDGIALRRYLHRKERFLAEGDQFLDIWREKVIRLIEGILGYLPDTLLAGDEDAARKSDSGAPFSVPLIDLCQKPAEVIERSIITLFDQDVTQAGIFDPQRERLNTNILLASGINPQNAQESTKALIFPTEVKRKSSRDIATTYCVGTAFAPFFAAKLPFDIPFPARFEHTHIVGGSGHGKTQLMQAMICDDLIRSQEDGRALVVIDSQGDLIKTISHLSCFSPATGSCADRIVIVDPTDIEYPVCLNLFDWGGKQHQVVSAVEREKLLNSAISLYEYIFGALLGAELTQKQGVIFKYLARLMLEIPDATIHTLGALMENGEPFRPYMEQLIGSARQFFMTRFFDRSFNETKKQILTRLWGVLSNSTLERIFGNPRNKIDLYGAINSGKIVLINTAKDLLTQDGSALFGRFFIALLSQAALQRASIPAHERRPCFVYIDEAADYFDDTIEQLLNQARKYKVGLVLAHQNLDQLSTGLEGSLMASTSIKFAGGVSAKDARTLSGEMHCESEFLQGMLKRKNETEFACFVRHFTPQAVPVTVPLGQVEALPTLSEAEHQSLIDQNRGRYCVSLEETLAREQQAPAPSPRQSPPPSPPRPRREPPASKGVSESERPLDKRSLPERPSQNETPPREPIPPVASPLPIRPRDEPTESKRPVPPRPKQIQPAALGRGGREHQYLQQLLKEAGEKQGFRAVIEEPILDGAGRIDVALIRGERKIACEISVASTKDQELGNVEKCLAAGFEEIIVVTAKDRQRQVLARFVGNALEEDQRTKVKFLLAEEAVLYLSSQTAESSEQVIRGYRVNVKQSIVSEAEQEIRRKQIADVIMRSIGRMKDKPE